LFLWQKDTGTHTLGSEGVIRWKSSDGKAGTTALYESDGKKMFRGVADDGSIVVELVQTP